jgi:hypothetical protein
LQGGEKGGIGEGKMERREYPSEGLGEGKMERWIGREEEEEGSLANLTSFRSDPSTGRE